MKNKEIIKTKLSQLEKQFSDLAKDVSELRQTLAKDVEVDVEIIKQETIKEEEIDFSVPQLMIHEDGQLIITTGVYDEHYFFGQSINQGSRHNQKWNRKVFKKFKGELTIK